MTNSGINSPSSELITLYQKLAKLSQVHFSIDVSAVKMQNDAEYRELVLSELFELGQADINQIINDIRFNAIESVSAEVTAKPAVGLSLLTSPVGLVVIGVMLIAISVGGFLMTRSSEPAQIVNQQPAVNTQAQTVVPAVASTPAVANSQAAIVAGGITLPVADPTLAFRLHGSNTIGEKLAPALIESYLSTQGVTDFYWQRGDHAVERTLQYVKDHQVYAIELHAHGSSTAFKDMSTGKADMGMASRQAKASEVTSLKNVLGDLSKIGNEHIIGLDGLAIIVNQNNTLKSLTTATLAKIFSGEIDNWSQLGGPSLPIKLYARDAKSGTYDTFKNLVLKKYKKNLSPNANRFESSSELTTLVSQDEGAIGFIGLNYIRHNKALSIAASAETTPIYPTRFTIGTEDYALSRRLYFYTPTRASDMIKDFARYVISREGQLVVEKTGLISQNIKVENVYPLDKAPVQYNQYARQAKRLSLNFHFNYGDQDLDNKGKRDLQRLVEFIEENPSSRLVLMGFSDSIGAKDKNQVLSLSRAKAVERELTSRGIPVVAVEGFGEQLPIANNDTDAGRERNRRVEVWVM